MNNLHDGTHDGIGATVDSGKKGSNGATSVASSEEMIIQPVGKVVGISATRHSYSV
jgi:hypothetical protein